MIPDFSFEDCLGVLGHEDDMQSEEMEERNCVRLAGPWWREGSGQTGFRIIVHGQKHAQTITKDCGVDQIAVA